jgi:hypothetical protein
MRKPKGGVPREVGSHPCADPDGRQTTNDEQHKKQMNNKYDIGQHGHCEIARIEAYSAYGWNMAYWNRSATGASGS